MPLRPTWLFWAGSALFVLSGFTGLAYEIIWFKRLSLVWGNSTLAMSAVVASFLFGLGLGSHTIGRVADRVAVPIRWYGLSEIAIGVLALLIPFETRALMALSSTIYPATQGNPAMQYAVRLVLTFLIIGPPCLLMGGTLPLLIRQYARADTNPGLPTSWFYAINTLGAAAGCYATGFHLLPALGLSRSNTLTAALNLAIGAAALLVGGRLAAGGAAPAATAAGRARATAPAPSRAPLPPLVLYVVIALAGLAALMLQIIWTRQIALVLGGSTYAFTAVLFAVLIGIALGSLIVHIVLSRWSRSLVLFLGASICLLVVSAAFGKTTLATLSSAVGLMRPLRGSTTVNAVVSVAVGGVVQLVPSLVMGMLFPLFVHLRDARAEAAGRAIGTAYATNTIGTIAGSTLTAMVLFPAIGTTGAMMAALSIYVAILLLLLPYAGRRNVAFFVAFVGASTLATLRLPASDDPLTTNYGFFIHGNMPRSEMRDEILLFKEGAACNVLVTEVHETRSLRVNGKVDANDRGDMITQLAVAYFPLFLHPDARDILVIGFGSGTTAGGSLLFPDARVTCCEIEPFVFAASEHFFAVNHQPERSPNFKIVFDDGRTFVQGTRETYDVILSEPSNPWIAGITGLFTRDFYEAASKKLRAGGILAQWIHTYASSATDYAMVARTLAKVFPHYGLVRVSGGDTILLASHSPLAPTRATVAAAQAIVDSVPALRNDLTRYFETTDVASLFLRHYLLDENGVRSLMQSVGSDGIITDENLRLEFDAPRRVFRWSAEQDSLNSLIVAGTQPEWIRQVASLGSDRGERTAALHKLVQMLMRPAGADVALAVNAVALEHDPDSPELLANRLVLAPAEGDSLLPATYESIVGRSVADANRVGVAFYQRQDYARGVAALEKIVEATPYSAYGWSNLGILYQRAGRLEEARAAFEKALALDPMNDFSRTAYGDFVKETGAGT